MPYKCTESIIWILYITCNLNVGHLFRDHLKKDLRIEVIKTVSSDSLNNKILLHTWFIRWFMWSVRLKINSRSSLAIEQLDDNSAHPQISVQSHAFSRDEKLHGEPRWCSQMVIDFVRIPLHKSRRQTLKREKIKAYNSELWTCFVFFKHTF